MKNLLKFALPVLCLSLMSCGGEEPKSNSSTPPPKSMVQEKLAPASERITLDDKGVGEIKEVTLDPEINQDWVAEGADIFKTNCTACHKIEKRFIGPSPKGILERRSPEWIMNMILDPQLMVEEDRCAMDLLVEFNGAAMANQNLTVEQTRSILEYFRTL
ncbi:MAG: cytochrome c [Cryomorphaceae bacterium]|jgi:cytochrome c